MTDAFPLPPAPVVPDAPGPALRIACFNARYSPNLGDGLLSECLEQTLIAQGAEGGTTSIDLAARTAYGDVMFARSTIMSVLESLPGGLRQLAIRAPLALYSARKWRPHYRAGLQGAQAVAIGGGNLLADIDLNFPTKLALAVDEAARANLPVAIYACGMSKGFSPAGLSMLRRAFARPQVKAVFLRDPASKALWDELMAPATGHVAQVVRDPGLLACDVWPAPPRPARAAKVIGLGIMSHLAIRYHSEGAPAADRLDGWYVDVARGLLAEGHEVRVFTNGSPEDRVQADRLRPALQALGAGISFLDQRTPAELCAHLASFDALLAYRMHAVIGAHSYGVPSVALAWDAKLAAFMASVGRQDHLIDVATTPAATAVRLAIAAAEAGLPEVDRLRVVQEARDGVRALRAVFRKAMA